MILADTFVWVDHFRRKDAELARLLLEEEVGVHPFVLGELAAGNLHKRADVLGFLALLPQTAVAEEREVHHLLDAGQLWGTGLGWVDLHLLAAARLTGWRLYSANRALNAAAARVGVGYARRHSDEEA